MTPPVAAVNFAREDEELTVRFMVRPAATTALGQYAIKAVATVGAESFDAGYQVVEYPHTRRRQLEMGDRDRQHAIAARRRLVGKEVRDR